MKPIKLTMQGFMTFNGLTEIDFSHLGGAGLFLVTGDTGSGKSTIFDAVCYALFGEVSGETRAKLNPVSDFITEGEECFVKLEFSHREKTYTVRRNPEYRGKKARGKGFCDVKKNAVLSFDDGREDLKGITPVNNEIISLLGTDRNRFKQISMLAQGEFTGFLRADSQEKSRVLRKIFNTEIYDTFNTRLYEVKKELEKQCRESDLRLTELLRGIAVDESDTCFEKISQWKNEGCNIYGADEIIDELKKLSIVTEKELKNAENSKTECEEAALRADIALSEAEKENALLHRLNALNEEKRALESRKEENEKNIQNLDLILRAKSAEGSFNAYRQEEKSFNEAVYRLEKNRSSLAEAEKEVKLWEETFNRENKNRPEAERLSAEILRLTEELKAYDSLDRVKRAYEENSKETQKAEKNYIKYKEATEKLKAGLEAASKELEPLRGTELCLVEQEHKKEDGTKLKSGLLKLSYDLESIEKSRKRILELEKEFTLAEKEYKDAVHSYEQARDVFLSGQASIMAKELKEGESCPVCGSVTHPKKAETPDFIPSEKELEALEEQRKSKDALSREKNSALREEKTRFEMLLKELKPKLWELAGYDGEINEDNEGCDNLKGLIFNKIRDTENEINEIDKKISFLKAAEEKKEKLEKNKKELEERINNGIAFLEAESKKRDGLRQTHIELKSRLEEMTKGLRFESRQSAEEDIKARSGKRDSLAENIKKAEDGLNNAKTLAEGLKAALSENGKNVQRRRESLKELEREYKKALVKYKLNDENELLSALALSENEGELKRKTQLYNDAVVRNRASLEEINKNIKEEKPKDLEKLNQRCKILSEEKNTAQKEYLRLYNKHCSNGDILKNALRLWSSQGQTRRSFVNAEELYNTANGTLAGKNRISLEEYVQAFYFSRIIIQANKRLSVMTDGQYELLRKESATKRSNEAFALDLVVFDYYTSKVRDISTLSGGETFKAALSLALGLSDVVQQESGGIETDAVFIDEGFGSLDSDSLEQAVSVLLSLTDGNRIVGIISHVNELKEKINKRLVVKKTLEGSTAGWQLG